MNETIDDIDVKQYFPELYEGYVAKPKELDDELGLEIVEKPTIYEMYGITLNPKSNFHKSLQSFFDRSGFLTPKQLKCFD